VTWAPVELFDVDLAASLLLGRLDRLNQIQCSRNCHRRLLRLVHKVLHLILRRSIVRDEGVQIIDVPRMNALK